MKIIVGLGNPGEKYANTYHNMGYKTVAKLADKLGKTIKTKECSSLTVVFSKNNENIVLALPETFMNLSGEAVKSLLAKYQANIDDLVVVYDDIDIPCGSLRLRKSGSAGTHNGMRNIVDKLGSTAFKRIRVGIGAKPSYMDIVDYVLAEVKGENKELVDMAIDNAVDALVDYLSRTNFDDIMQKYNGKN